MIRACRPWSNFAVFFRVFLERPSKMVRFNTIRAMKNKSDLKNANLKKDAVSSVYQRFLIYRSYLSVTEKSNTHDVSFPQASISKNNYVSLNQLKGLAASQKCCQQDSASIFDRIFIKFANTQDRHKILDEF